MATHEKEDISLLPVVGWIAFLIGAGLLGWGWFYDSTVASEASAYVYVAERVHNIGLLGTKLSILITGGAVMILGVVLLAANGIRAEIRRAERSAPPPAP